MNIIICSTSSSNSKSSSASSASVGFVVVAVLKQLAGPPPTQGTLDARYPFATSRPALFVVARLLDLRLELAKHRGFRS